MKVNHFDVVLSIITKTIELYVHIVCRCKVTAYLFLPYYSELIMPVILDYEDSF